MNYSFYKSNFGGTLIPPELFNRFLFKAQTYLKKVTFSREIPEDYKRNVSFALCEMAEVFFRRQSAFGIKSENTDGYSVTYSDNSIFEELYQIAELYLGDTGLLFKGEY